MTSRSLLSKWFVEYTSPLVVTIATAEVESICLKNGLLFHELLSAFGHLDNLSATVRSVNHQIPVIDAHIRFERSSEVVPKSSGAIEEYLRESFIPFEMAKMPRDPEELKLSPPSGWSSKIEQTLMRSMSFTEYEMTSHPIIFLTVVATTDVDHVGCMNELSSNHHVPSCFSTGQYDPEIHRVYLLLHDVSSAPHVDTGSILRLLKSKFSPSHTKLLCINSLPASTPNLQHPDIWSRWKIPMFFPQHAPQHDPIPQGERVVYGSRLSMEDYMSLRTFCIELFQQEILPAYERRVGILLRQVNEAKKGVKNVFKSFWRKPRDNSTHMKGVAKYRYDRIEAQTLLLGDTAFCMRDYDAALSMYRLVKDDFKADKVLKLIIRLIVLQSTLHYAHTNLMIAACQFMLEPGVRTRDLVSTIEAVTQCIQSNTELPHASAFYAYILSELLTSHPQNKTPLEAVQLLLLAAGYLNRFPILSALLTEKAAHFYIPARQYRKYSLHIVLAGHKFNSCGTTATIDHSSICFASAMILYDNTEWSTVKSKLWRALADRLKVVHSASGPRIALLLLLQILSAITSKNRKSFNGTTALNDAVKVYHELIHDRTWGNLTIPTGWESINTRDILLDKTAYVEQVVTTSPSSIDPENIINLINSVDIEENTSPTKVRGLTIIEDLRLPEIFMESVVLMTPLNGSTTIIPHGVDSPLNPKIELLKSFLDVERSIEKAPLIGNYSGLLEMCADKFVAADYSVREGGLRNLSGSPLSGSGTSALLIPLGEKVVLNLQLYNPLPIDLLLRDLQIIMNLPESFDVLGTEVIIPSGTTRDITLIATPLSVGTFRVNSACWYLGERVQIIQHIRKKGTLLQKTLAQRAQHQRAPDTTLTFNVVETCPLLRLDFEKDLENAEVLCGEIFRTSLSIFNEGSASAKNLELIFNFPVAAVELFSVNGDISQLNYQSDRTKSVSFLPFVGQSCTAVRLPSDIIIRSGGSVQLRLWLRFPDVGNLEISLLASYQSALSDRVAPRTSFCSFNVIVLPSVDLSMTMVPRQSSPISKSMILTLANRIPADELASRYGIVDPIASQEMIPPDMQRAGEGCFCVTGLLYLGAGRVVGDIVGIFRDSDKTAKQVANSSEKLSLFLPIELVDPSEILSKPESLSECRSWMIKSTNSYESLSTDDIFEKFTSISYANHCLMTEMNKSRVRWRETQGGSNDNQPRLISQVRKERNTMKFSTTESDNLLLDLSDFQGINLVTYDELSRGQLTLGISWLTYWKGKLHHGISLLHHQPILKYHNRPDSIGPVLSPKLLTSLSNQNQLSDVITVGFNHHDSLIWDFSQGRCPLRIMVQIHSIHPTKSFVISVEALEWLDMMNTKALNRRKRPPMKGLHWEGKSRYIDLTLSPMSSISLPFLALVSKRGVYNIKRFRITVNSENELTPPTIKVLDGQSLVTIQ